MVLGVLEGQIRGGYFPDYILDSSVIDCNDHACMFIKPEPGLYSVLGAKPDPSPY